MKRDSFAFDLIVKQNRFWCWKNNSILLLRSLTQRVDNLYNWKALTGERGLFFVVFIERIVIAKGSIGKEHRMRKGDCVFVTARREHSLNWNWITSDCINNSPGILRTITVALFSFTLLPYYATKSISSFCKKNHLNFTTNWMRDFFFAFHGINWMKSPFLKWNAVDFFLFNRK